MATENGPVVAAGREGPGSSITALCVCACTYRRPEGLKALLEGLGRQEFPSLPPPKIHIVIADNEGSPEARAICEEFRKQSGIPLTYVHEPQRGISFARNACLDHIPPECEFFAFIDDDEVPEPDWLDHLLLVQARTEADVVAGVVEPVFCDATPIWIAKSKFFGTPRRIYDLDCRAAHDLEHLRNAATNNVLVRTSKIRSIGLKFDERFALSGGEDTLFFRVLSDSGCRMVRSKYAVVHERIPPFKASFLYMFRERFRTGSTDVFVSRHLTGGFVSFKFICAGLRHVWLGLRRLAKTTISRRREPDRFAAGAFHIAYGAGMISAAFGWRYHHYK